MELRELIDNLKDIRLTSIKDLDTVDTTVKDIVKTLPLLSKVEIEQTVSDLKNIISSLKGKASLQRFEAEEEPEYLETIIERLDDIYDLLQNILDAVNRMNQTTQALAENFNKVVKVFPDMVKEETWQNLIDLVSDKGEKQLIFAPNFDELKAIAHQIHPLLAKRLILGLPDIETLEPQLRIRRIIIIRNGDDVRLPLMKELLKLPIHVIYNALAKFDREAELVDKYYKDFGEGVLLPPVEALFGLMDFKEAGVMEPVVDGLKLTKDAVAKVLSSATDKLSSIWRNLLTPASVKLILTDWPEAFMSAPASFRKEVAAIAKSIGVI